MVTEYMTAEVFMATEDGVNESFKGMSGPLSVIPADIHMVRSGNVFVRSLNPSFYKRFVNDIIILNSIKTLKTYCLKT